MVLTSSAKVSAKVRATRQRGAIRAVFERERRPLHAHEVHALAPGIGIATVYRALQMLAEEGWLKAISLPGAVTYYERSNLEHHHHFRCSICERVFDVAGCARGVDALAPPGFQVHRHEILLVGECAGCLGSRGQLHRT